MENKVIIEQHLNKIWDNFIKSNGMPLSDDDRLVLKSAFYNFLNKNGLIVEIVNGELFFKDDNKVNKFIKFSDIVKNLTSNDTI